MSQLAPSRLIVLLVTDIVGSTDLKSRIGLDAYARRLSAHDELFKRLIAAHESAEILKDTGDGYFASFATTSDAVRFALRFQDELRRAAADDVLPLKARVGIHVGEVAQMDLETTGKPKIVGLAADLVVRVTHLASGGQILLTRFAFNEARQFVSAPSDDSHSLEWVAHGAYRLKGYDEPVDIFEVGIAGAAPLTAPAGSDEARRAVAHDDEDTLGWRPAIGLEIPGRPQWALERRLGEGGFGEVWLARHAKLGLRRVFKFCFDADRLRSFKRELTLFRLLRDALGDRTDLARIHEVKLDESPYFLESEYTEGGDLHAWTTAQGGVDKVPLSTRLDIVARVADAVAAAHSVGVLHKDIKPSNVLIAVEDGGGQPRPRLSDFGIGMLTDPARLADRAITASGFTQMTLGASSQTGTRVYVPPEVLVGRPFTVQGDVYALGVLLYQMIVGDLNRPLAEGWERDVADELLREDVAACVEGDPSRRLGSAAELAKRLRSLDARRDERQGQAEAERLAQRRRRTTRVAVVGLAVMAILASIAAAFAWRERALRREAEAARFAEARQRAVTRSVNRFLNRMLTSVDPDKAMGKDVTVVRAIDAAYDEFKATRNRTAAAAATTRLAVGAVDRDDLDDRDEQARLEAEASILDTIGRAYRAVRKLDRSEEALREALEVITKLHGPDNANTYDAMGELAVCLNDAGKVDEAIALMTPAVSGLRRTLGMSKSTTLTHAINYAMMLLRQDRIDEAESIVREVVEQRLKLDGPNDDQTITAQETLAGIAYQRRDYNAAADLFNQVYEARRRTRGDDHPLTLLDAQNAATAMYRIGRTAEADARLEQLIETQRKVLGETHPRTLKAMENRAPMLMDLNRPDEAIALQRKVYELRERTQGPDHPDTLESKRYLGGMYRKAEKYDEAIATLKSSLDDHRRVRGETDPETLKSMSALAVTYLAAGKADESFELHQAAVDTCARTMGPSHPNTLVMRMDYAVGLMREKRYADCEKQLLLAWNAAQDKATASGATRRSIAVRLVRTYELWGKPDLAAEWKAKADAAAPRPSSGPSSAPSRAPATMSSSS